jgi:ribonuclease-3
MQKNGGTAKKGREQHGAEPVAALLCDRQASLALCEERMGYRFKEASHLLTALIHSSFAFEQVGKVLRDNEVLEFLGDAVLDLAVAKALFVAFPAAPEGELTRMRAALVNETSLAALATEIRLGDFLLLGKGEENTGGRTKPSILSSVYEAVLGAVFVDGGYEAARVLVERQFAPLFAQGKRIMLQTDAKSRLQEMAQERFNEAPTYGLEKEEGPDHEKRFTVSVRFRDRVLATATASNKKEAEQRAAALALESFNDHDFAS